jgi:transposase
MKNFCQSASSSCRGRDDAPSEAGTTQAKAGVWLRIFEALAQHSPPSLHLIDSSIVRAHQHAAGGKKGARITPSAVLVED